MSVTTPADLSSFADLVDESIQDIFIKRGEQPTKMEQYFNVESTTSYYDKDSSVSGTEKAKFISENASVIYDAPLQGFDKRYVELKSLLINGESPEVGNPQQAGYASLSRAAATTEYRDTNLVMRQSELCV